MAIPGATGAVQAAAAYAAAGRGAPAPAASEGFGGMLARAMDGAVGAGRAAEAGATQAMLGQGGVTEAVLAISQAEIALQTAVAIRDRVVSAYQDIMRMPI